MISQKGQKNGPKWEKILLSLISQETYIIWLSFIWHKCKMIISAGFFFKILIFWVVRRVKRQKIALNDKKLLHLIFQEPCLSHSISQQAYIIWSWFLVHKCKIMASRNTFSFFMSWTIPHMIHMFKTMIYPAIFFIFSKLWILGVFFFWGGGESKKWLIITNFSCHTSVCLKNHR